MNGKNGGAIAILAMIIATIVFSPRIVDNEYYILIILGASVVVGLLANVAIKHFSSNE